MTITKQQELWSGPFGDLYVDRNLVTEEQVKIRELFWDKVLKLIYMNSSNIPMSFLEVGAGQGVNLRALQDIYHRVDKSIDLYATEINQRALNVLKQINNIKILDRIDNVEGFTDCVITYGLLIHTHPAHVKPLLANMYKCTRKYIVCCEYFAPVTRAIPYHGEPDALWLDDYGSHWLNNHPLRVLGHGFCWKRLTQLDNITFWIFEKVQ